MPVPVPPPTYTLKPAACRGPSRPRSTSRRHRARPALRCRGSSGRGSRACCRARGLNHAAPAWDADRTFADDLDLDAVLARRRAVNG